MTNKVVEIVVIVAVIDVRVGVIEEDMAVVGVAIMTVMTEITTKGGDQGEGGTETILMTKMSSKITEGDREETAEKTRTKNLAKTEETTNKAAAGTKDASSTLQARKTTNRSHRKSEESQAPGQNDPVITTI